MATVSKSERTFWHTEATSVLQTILKSRRITYKQLSRMLEGLGEHEPEKTLSNKINRGTFSFIFFLKCMHALGRSDVRFLLTEVSPTDRANLRRLAKAQRRRTFPTKS
jgi:hypothetical protein